MSGPDYYKSMIDSYEKKLRAKDKQIKRLDEHNKWLIDKVNELADKVKGLEEQADDMAEKHAEKDIVINDLVNAFKYTKEAVYTERCTMNHMENTDYENGRVEGLAIASNILNKTFKEDDHGK